MPTRRILIVRLSHLGDVVHALPVFHALRAAHPEAEIAWAVQPEFADLLDGLPGLARTFHFGRRAGLRAWPRLRKDLVSFAPEWTIDAQGNTKSAFVTLLSGAARRSGLHRSDWTEAFGASVLTDCAPAVEGNATHAMDRMCALARHVAPEHASTNGSISAIARTDCALTPCELERGRADCERFFGREGVRPTVLHLVSPDDVRSWPLEHFEALARELALRGRRVLTLSGPAEEREGRVLALRLAGLKNVEHWVAQRGLRALAAFFTAAAERDARFIGCDSGPAHLAAACGLSVIGLSGPQDERRTGPWPLSSASSHRVVRAEHSPPCAPCLSRRCHHPRGPVCMRDLQPSRVVDVLEAP